MYAGLRIPRIMGPAYMELLGEVEPWRPVPQCVALWHVRLCVHVDGRAGGVGGRRGRGGRAERAGGAGRAGRAGMRASPPTTRPGSNTHPCPLHAPYAAGRSPLQFVTAVMARW